MSPHRPSVKFSITSSVVTFAFRSGDYPPSCVVHFLWLVVLLLFPIEKRLVQTEATQARFFSLLRWIPINHTALLFYLFQCDHHLQRSTHNIRMISKLLVRNHFIASSSDYRFTWFTNQKNIKRFSSFWQTTRRRRKHLQWTRKVQHLWLYGKDKFQHSWVSFHLEKM